MSITRTRLTPAASREAALEAARVLLIEQGPQAVTLKAVAARVGRTHGNLLHHFGSAAGLQRALTASLAERITAGIGEAVRRARAGEADPRLIVDLTFDAFGREGGGALASWAILSGDRAALDPIVTATRQLVDQLGPHEGRPVEAITLTLVLTALGDALMGGEMAQALGLPREAARAMATERLLALATGPGAAPASGFAPDKDK
ncbi:TetR/AcrR family transcriptional regulator [Sphingomonas solaris]|uniref:TetR/AcrR family transcriptional regulator n=1 Tax=Alterirhizorhabdus solaris TaxID=2529389 RepID=A0A558R9J0_9SPHN|nr:TetR/AcrR family transcriptional regulator [Sphingomonas solaris]TVV76049.1 TetR/AcrR family transcriptional regulator [Sphingomonas solaris]